MCKDDVTGVLECALLCKTTNTKQRGQGGRRHGMGLSLSVRNSPSQTLHLTYPTYHSTYAVSLCVTVANVARCAPPCPSSWHS